MSFLLDPDEENPGFLSDSSPVLKSDISLRIDVISSDHRRKNVFFSGSEDISSVNVTSGSHEVPSCQYKPYRTVYEKERVVENDSLCRRGRKRTKSRDKYSKLLNSDCFLSDLPIHVEIIGDDSFFDKSSTWQSFHARTDSTASSENHKGRNLIHSHASHFLQKFRHSYTIRVSHGEFEWVILRYHGQFRQLHDRIVFLKMKSKLMRHQHSGSIQSEETGIRHSSVKNEIGHLPKFPLSPDVTGRHAVVKRKFLEEYLQAIVNIKVLRNLPEMLNFLEISRFSFITRLGIKRKEGMIMKRCGDRATSKRVCGPSFGFLAKWRKRWLIVKDSFVGYVRPGTAQFGDILLIDQLFEVACKRGFNLNHELIVRNASRSLIIKCPSDTDLKEWYNSIISVLGTTGRIFKNMKQNGSYAPVRFDAYLQWYVDGMIFYEAVANAISVAKDEIFIAGWWVTPELYMKRGVKDVEEWRLDNLLWKKANEGVRVFILLYKPMEMILMLGTGHVVTRLKHENIKILRHPTSFPSGKLMYSHHEKVVVIDQTAAFIGGLDLALGRWDTRAHDVADIILSPTFDDGKQVESRKLLKDMLMTYTDYVDPDDDTRIEENDLIGPKHVSFSDEDSVSVERKADNCDEKECQGRSEYLKQTIKKHFLKRTISTSSAREPLQSSISLKQVKNDKRNTDSAKRRRFKQLSQRALDKVLSMARADETVKSELLDLDERVSTGMSSQKSLHWLQQSREPTFTTNPLRESCINRQEMIVEEQERVRLNVRLKRSIKKLGAFRSDRKTVSSVSDNPENQIYDTETGTEEVKVDSLSPAIMRQQSVAMESTQTLFKGQDYVNWIIKSPNKLVKPFADGINRALVPRMPWHDVSCAVYGRCARDVGRHFIERWNAAKREIKKQSMNYPFLVPKSYEHCGIDKALAQSTHPCIAQILRSVSKWSAGISKTECSILKAYLNAIQSAEHYIYIENQFFISATEDDKTVTNKIADALFSRIMEMHKRGNVFRVFLVLPLLPAVEGTVDSWRGVPMRGILYYQLRTLCQGPHSLVSRLRLSLKDEASPTKYLSITSLRNYSCVYEKLKTELIYVHSKMMLVDDNQVIIGSANINDRSMLGHRDSEIAIYARDLKFVPSRMNDNVFAAGKFTFSLRVSLMCEHLGLQVEAGRRTVQDPVVSTFYDDVWTAAARENTRLYEEVFKCYPTDKVKKFNELKKFESNPLADTDRNKSIQLLSCIKGHLVLYQQDFLCEENLFYGLNYFERMLPRELWT